MHRGEVFTFFEGYSLITITFLFHTFDETLSILAGRTGSAAWLAQIVGAALGAGLFYLYLWLFRSHNGKDIVDIYSAVYGKVLGKVVQLLLLGYLAVFTAINLHEVADILRVFTYPESSPLFIKAAIMLSVAIVAIFSVKGLGKTVALCLPVCLLSLLAILLLSAKEYDPGNLYPVFGYGLREVAASGFTMLGNYDGLLIVSVFLSYYGSAKDFHKSGLAALLTGIACFVATALCYNLAFPYSSASHSMSGVLDLAQGIYINRFFQRFESIFVAIISTVVLLVLCLSFLGVKKVYCSLFGIPQKNAYAVSVSLALLVLCLSTLLERNSRLREMSADAGQRYGVYFVLGLLCLTLLVGLLRKGGGRKARKYAALLLAPCLLMGTLSGCNSHREPDEEVYAIVLGVDKGETLKYKISLKFLQEYKEADAGGAAQGGGDGEDPPENVFVAEADAGLKAVEMLGASISRHISLSHLKMVVFSEELAREGVGDVLLPVVDRTEAKSNMAFVICSGEAKDYVCNNESLFSASLPMEMEMLMQPKKGTANYKVVTVSDVLRNMTSHHGDSVAIYAGLQQTQEEVKQEDKLHMLYTEREKEVEQDPQETGQSTAGPQAEKPAAGQPEGNTIENPPNLPAADHDGVPGYLPHNIPVRGASTYEYAGMAVLRGDRMVGVMDTLETAIFMMMEGTHPGAIFSLPDPDDSTRQIVLDIKTRQPTKLRTRVQSDGVAHIQLTACVGATIELAQNLDADYTSALDTERLERYVEGYIRRQAGQLILRSQAQWDADILLLGKKMAGEFSTIQDWEAYDWPSQYPDAVINVDVDLQIIT